MKEYFFNEIYYRKNEFQPARPTLVFMHGVSGSSSAWLPYEKIFEENYNLLIYDIRGHGMSKKFPNYEDYEIKNFVNDFHELASYLNIKKFVLISNSFAALVHLEYLKLYREDIAANVFTSPEVYLGKGLKAAVFRAILKIILLMLKFLPFDPKPRGHVDYKKYTGSTDWSIGRNFADMRNTGMHAHFYTLRQSMNPGQDYDLQKISVPTLIIHGLKDTMVPVGNAVLMAQAIKNAEFIGVPNVDHNTAHNAVKVMSEAIEAFIKKNT